MANLLEFFIARGHSYCKGRTRGKSTTIGGDVVPPCLYDTQEWPKQQALVPLLTSQTMTEVHIVEQRCRWHRGQSAASPYAT